MSNPRPQTPRPRRAVSDLVEDDAGQGVLPGPTDRPDVDRSIELTRRQWEIGRRVSDLMERAKADQGRTNPGKVSLRKIAPANGLNHDLARVALQVYEVFPTKESLEKLLRRRRKDGKPLPSSTIALLCRPSMKARRQELFERVFSENLSDDDLKDLLRAEAPPKAKPARFGRRPSPPRSLVLALEGWGSKARECSRYIDGVLTEEFILAMIQERQEADVKVSAFERAEQALAGAIEAMGRQMAAVRRIREAVRVSRAGTTTSGPGSGPESDPRGASEPGAAGSAKRPRRSRDRSGR